jgi:hypothetical protein
MKDDLTLECARRLVEAAEYVLRYAFKDAHADRVIISREQTERLRGAVEAFRTQDRL